MPLPRAVVCAGAGAVMGWAAVLPALVGSVLGAAIGFAVARSVFGPFVRRALARRPGADALMRAIEAEGWRVIVPLRLASPVPSPAVNFACGVSRIGFGEYLAATVLGFVPPTLLFVYLGRAGGAALTDGRLLGVGGLTAAVGLALTAVALWRLAVAARRMMAEANPPSP